jgi:catechol 2,3-dioxygenase-like lactoylglutathione lyase family enzyme
MSVELNHTIIPAKDKWVSAKFLADILNLEAGPEWGHFVPVKTANGVTLDFDNREDFRPAHYAFLVSDAEFDAAFARITSQGLRYYADPRRSKPGEINHHHGGRGVYFDDPNGHLMEIITQPYGDVPQQQI